MPLPMPVSGALTAEGQRALREIQIHKRKETLMGLQAGHNASAVSSSSSGELASWQQVTVSRLQYEEWKQHVIVRRRLERRSQGVL